MTDGQTYLTIWDSTGERTSVSMEDESRIDAAVSQWIASGRTQDTLLDLTCPEGAPYKVLASTICGWYTSSPDSRRRLKELNKELDVEDKRVRAELGIWDADE
jgi:hypothetical protein